MPKDKSKSTLPSFWTLLKIENRIRKNEDQSVSMVTPRPKFKILLVVIKLGHHDNLYKMLSNFIILPSIDVCMVLS